MIIELVELMEDGTEYVYTYESCQNDLYRSEDGQQYTKAELEQFRLEMQKRGILARYTER